MTTTSAARRRRPVAAALGCVAAAALIGCASATAAPSDPGPAGAAAGQVPVSVSAVSFSENLGMNAHGKRPPAPMTIVSKAKAREIVALINAQKPFPPGQYNCPMDDGQSLTMSFRDGGSVVATAKIATSGCQAIDISAGSASTSARGPAVGRTVAAKALKIAGLPWKLPALG